MLLFFCRALGTFVHYFEGATQSHINAVIHTRQAYPPTKVSHLHIPFIVNGISVLQRRENDPYIDIEFEINISCKCRLFLIEDFNTNKFKISYNKYFSEQIATSPSIVSDMDQCIDKIYNSMYSSSRSAQGMVELLRPNLGYQKVRFTCRAACDSCTVGIVIIPIQDSSHAPKIGNSKNKKGFSNVGFSNSTYRPISKNVNNYDVEEGTGVDGEGGGILLTNYENSSNPLHNMSYNDEELLKSNDTGIDFAVNIARLELTSASTKSLSGELLLFSKKGGPIYSSMEIFGLKEQQTADVPSKDPNEAPSAFASYMHSAAKAPPPRIALTNEDCVICLTDPQQVLFLPCRHMCVCRSCLVKIDKCPVCRATFEEYMSLIPASHGSSNGNSGKDENVRTSDIITL